MEEQELGEVITIRGDEEDRYDGEEEEDDWHRARRGRSEEKEVTERGTTRSGRPTAAVKSVAQGSEYVDPRRDSEPIQQAEQPVDDFQGLLAMHRSSKRPAPEEAGAVAAIATGNTEQASSPTGPPTPQAQGKKAKRAKRKRKAADKRPGLAIGAMVTRSEQEQQNEATGASPLEPSTTPTNEAGPRGLPQERGRGGRGGRGRGRGGAEGPGGGAGRGRGGAGQRGMTPVAVDRICEELRQMPHEKAATMLSEYLHERKTDKIGKILGALGVERTLRLFTETMAVERRGGMNVIVGRGTDKRERRRTSGGVFLTLLKEHASKQEMQTINETEQQRKNAGRKRKRGVAPIKADTEVSTSRLRDASVEEDEMEEEEGEREGHDFEIIEAPTHPRGGGDVEAELPDRVTVEIMRQQRGKRQKRTVTALPADHQNHNHGTDNDHTLAQPNDDDNPFGGVW